jgi:hypothetical protein
MREVKMGDDAGLSVDNPTVVEFSQSRSHSGSGAVGQYASADIHQYIQEMCVTLAYMATEHNSNRLSRLLLAAAAQAEACQSGADGDASAAQASPKRNETR